MSGLIAKLRGERSVAATGQLSLDREKAREKLRKFRLPDPHYYVLQFVRAAAVLEATTIDFAVDTDEMECRFDRAIPAELLEDLWGVAFEQRQGTAAIAAHHLSLGLGSAQALNPAVIYVDSDGTRLRLEGERESVEVVPVEQGTTRIYLREKFRFGHLVEFFTAWGQSFPEMKALSEHCAFSSGMIRCNGMMINRPLSNLRYESGFQTEAARGFVGLDPIAQDTKFHFMKNNVKVASTYAPNHGLAGVIVADSEELQTDLGGMSLIRNEVFDRVVREVMYEQYHEVLLRWAEGADVSLLECQELAAEVLGYVGLMKRANHELGPHTRALCEFVMRQRLFAPALAMGPGRWLSIAEVVKDGVVCFSTDAFPKLHSEERVLHVPASPGEYAVDVEPIILALKRSGMVEVRDVTRTLKLAQQAQRNRELWQAQPVATLCKDPLQRRFSVAGALGAISLPQHQPGQPEQGSCALCIGSRLIRRKELTGHLSIAIDGEFEPNGTFDDVVRDETFAKLVVGLCGEAVALHQEYATNLIASGVAASERPRLLDEFVLALLQGRFCTDLFRAAGYMPREALALERRAQAELARVLWFARAHSSEEVLDVLGAIADVPSIATASGEFWSLRRALTTPGVSLLEPTGDLKGHAGGAGDDFPWNERLLRQIRSALPEEMLSTVLCVDAVQKELLLEFNPGLPDARELLERALNRAAFESRELFVDRHPSADVIASESFSTPEARVTLQLVLGGIVGTCKLLYVFKQRQLATRLFDMPVGSFRAVIECDAIRPTADFGDMVDDSYTVWLSAEVRSHAERLISTWWNQPRQGDQAISKSSKEWALYVEFAFGLAQKQPNRAVIPVLRLSEGRWRSADVSLQTLRKKVAENGNVLHFTRSGEVDASAFSDGDTLVLPTSSLAASTVRKWIGSKVKAVVATAGATVGLEARERFLKKPVLEPEVRGRAVRWHGEVGGLDVHTAMFSDPTYGEGRQHINVSARYEEREVELIDVDVPFGQFRSVISGDLLAPDPTYKFVSEGRSELLRAAVASAAATLREVCRKFSAGVQAPELLALGDDLVRYIPIVRGLQPEPPFDLGDLLETTPLFQTTDGTRLSLRELELIANDGVVAYDEERRSSRILRLESSNVGPLERALDGALALRPAAELDLALEALPSVEPVVMRVTPPPIPPAVVNTVVPPPPPSDLSDPLLDAVATMLLAARRKRHDLFDDRTAGSLCWARLAGGRLCDVSVNRLAIDRDHPLVQRVIELEEPGAIAFLASAVYTAVNAYYARITDPDELEFQSRLLRSRRG